MMEGKIMLMKNQIPAIMNLLGDKVIHFVSLLGSRIA